MLHGSLHLYLFQCGTQVRPGRFVRSRSRSRSVPRQAEARFFFYASVVYARKRTCASVVHQAGSRSRLLSSGETVFPVGEGMFKYVWFVYEQ